MLGDAGNGGMQGWPEGEPGFESLAYQDQGQGAMESTLVEVAAPQEGRLSPLPGDVVLFHDGHSAIVVEPLCVGCRSFGVAEFTNTRALDMGVPPTIRETIAWVTNVRLILRFVLEKETSRRGAE